ncbi:hypothetical protein [Streptacidiphilus pinicola]|uniref:hypothetical protein n=1 Tax=Streptacidiphilus pinicola TaxID=2219663 RepID=UPI001FB1B6CD|nr:hypothetical protein [Streptacidiphilus pinicola]
MLLPGPGQTVRSLEVAVPVSGGRVSAQTVLLAMMLFGAGLSVRVAALGAVARRPGRLAVAVVVNAGLPAVVVPVLAVGLVRWNDPSEAEALAAGMLLMVTMPVAGGAVSWGQRGQANMPLIVAAVVGSTLLSPVTIPLGLRLTGRLLGPSGAGALDDTDTLSHLATSGAGASPWARWWCRARSAWRLGL